MRGQRGLFTLEAGERRIVDDQGARCRSRSHGRRSRAAPQEADLADRGTGARDDEAACTPGGLPIDVDATVGDHVHVSVVLALPAEHSSGLEAYLSADRL